MSTWRTRLLMSAAEAGKHLQLGLAEGVVLVQPARVFSRNAVHCTVLNGSKGENAPSLLSRTPTHPGASVVISTQSFAPCEYDDLRHPPAWARAAPVDWWFTTAPGLAGSASPRTLPVSRRQSGGGSWHYGIGAAARAARSRHPGSCRPCTPRSDSRSGRETRTG